MHKAILIDDEEIALDVMNIMLDEVGGVEVVGKYQLVAEALAHCGELKPDLIFLDIEMPGVNGLDAAVDLTVHCPDAKIVFVTAHDQYAIDAYDTDAIGYLLKPVVKDKLVKLLLRYNNLQNKQVRQMDHSSKGEDNQVTAATLSINSGNSSADKKALQLKVLGSMELYTPSGRLMTWRTKKTKELFAFLWHHRGQHVYKYAILEHLWPNDTADRGHKLLHTSLYYLRSMFKLEGYDGFVKYGDDKYWIDPSAVRSDLDELHDGLKAIKAGGAIEGTLQLYSGDYLDMEYYDWANAYRVELRAVMISTMTLALDEATEEMRIQLLKKLIELEPSQWDYYELLADAFNKIGDQAGARQIKVLQKQMSLNEE
ncbi:two-component SAPR family response regulator [Paenibacillus turicensis]|uniref:Two-component SAPR family response regulator n=1 Tax=Paenibacillus turicensis TaxID=160487 RepID=A0ABS4FV88_9BACL|nr:response regulator [Paenibacillus turicensis]MBP1906497.1 two-component SAPR family response regulator [Paenibacillus turicensis]